MSDESQGWEGAALWGDARFGLAHRNDFEKMGVIGGTRWVEWGLRLADIVVSDEIRNFSPGDARRH